LIKHRDQFASSEDVTAEQPRSAISGKLLAEIARDHGGEVEKAATGDPAPSKKQTVRTAKRATSNGVGTRSKSAAKKKV
jgi:hypothetical protein